MCSPVTFKLQVIDNITQLIMIVPIGFPKGGVA